MPWFALLLMLAGAYVTIRLVGINKNQKRLKFLGLTIASSIFTLMQLSILIEGLTEVAQITVISDFIVEWGHIVCLAFILSSLVVFIRESKPVFAQFPMVYTALPLLILISYFLVKDTYALKDWLLAFYQGGAILVSLLMYAVYTYRQNEYRFILSGIFLLLLSYIFYWHIPGIKESQMWLWKLLVIFGLITTITGYQKVETGSAAGTKLQKEAN